MLDGVHFYNQTLKKSVAVFGTIFNNLKIVKTGASETRVAKTQDEALQIFEQILPTFDPEYTVAIKDMDGIGNSVDVPIVLTGTTIQDDYEGDFTTRRTIVYTLDFQMKIRFTGRVTPKPVIRAITADLYNSSTEETAETAVDRVQTDLGSVDDTPEDFTTNTTFGFDDE